MRRNIRGNIILLSKLICGEYISLFCNIFLLTSHSTNIGKEFYKNLIENDLIEPKMIKDVKPRLHLLEKIAESKRNKCTKHIDKKKNENIRYPRY